MEIAALVIAVLAAAFTGAQWAESRESRRIAQKAHDLSVAVEARQQKTEERSAVAWRPRRHPEFGRWIELEHVGVEPAYRVRASGEDLASVRHRRLDLAWKLEPGQFYMVELIEETDLQDFPERLRIYYRLTETETEDRSMIVSLSGLRAELLEASRIARKREEDFIRDEERAQAAVARLQRASQKAGELARDVGGSRTSPAPVQPSDDSPDAHGETPAPPPPPQ